MMTTQSVPTVDVTRAKEVWETYQQTHNMQPWLGKTVAIEPVSQRVWFGESATDVWRKMAADGVTAPAYCVRVGRDFYLRKGGHR